MEINNPDLLFANFHNHFGILLAFNIKSPKTLIGRLVSYDW